MTSVCMRALHVCTKGLKILLVCCTRDKKKPANPKHLSQWGSKILFPSHWSRMPSTIKTWRKDEECSNGNGGSSIGARAAATSYGASSHSLNLFCFNHQGLLDLLGY